ncbi:MAG TPA: SprT family zinc-dependent metalloprotease [Pseudomonadales bacterium]
MPANTTIAYRITRSRRKTIALYVRDGSIEVRAPLHADDAGIHDWVNSKQGWIVQQLQRQASQQQQKPLLCDGGSLLFLGRPRQLQYIRGTPAIIEQDDRLLVRHRQPSQMAGLLQQWLRTEAELYLTGRTRELAAHMQETRLSDIRFRKTRSKWGHCTSTGVLQFNWLIIMAPPEVIDYLIVHELSHLQHMNHSPAFWQRVECFCPDYRQLRQWLKDNGHRLAL